MKIIYVITKSNFGGAQRYVFELAEGMRTRGQSVALASGPEGRLVDLLKEADIPHFPIHNFQRDINFLKEPLALFELYRLFKKENPDVVHLNSSKASGLGAVAARLAGVPQIVFTAHGWPFLEPRSFLWRLAAYIGSYLTALLSHKVILVSENDLRHTNMPGTKNKLIVIHTAVPEIDFKTRNEARQELFDAETVNRHQGDVWLITNAELNHNKNQLTAIKAVAEYNQSNSPKIFYSLMSDGQDKEMLEKFIREQNLENEVSLLGYVNDGRVYLKAFDIFILPSLKEGLPYALLEAGSAGLPAIAAKVGGIPEVIENEKTGLLVDPKNSANIKDSLQTLIQNESLRNSIALNLKNKVAAEYTLAKMIKETDSIYKGKTTSSTL